MSKSQHEQLFAQLNNQEKPKARAKACKKLAATRDPSVILALRKVYESDTDEKVKAAARDALVQFKTMEAKLNRGRADRMMRSLLIILVLLFVVSLAINGALIIADQGDEGDSKHNAGYVALNVTDRFELIQQIGSKLTESQALKNNLRAEIEKYNNTGQVDCEAVATYTAPLPLELSADDSYTYPDIRLISETFNAMQPKFEIAFKLFENACLRPEEQTTSVIKVAQSLDNVEVQLDSVNSLLQQAITSPAPTVGPTITPVPTNTNVPPTLPPTNAPVGMTSGSATPQPASTQMIPVQNTPVASVPTATATPLPTPTLPLPNLDYAAILASVNERLSSDYLFDLQNPYGTGMLDQWQQSITGRGQTTTNYCALTAAWPEPFTLSSEQLAQLTTPGVADPQLEEAIQLQQDAYGLAQQARPLYERDCVTFALSTSAEQGILLLTEAVAKLERTQRLLDEIAARP